MTAWAMGLTNSLGILRGQETGNLLNVVISYANIFESSFESPVLKKERLFRKVFTEVAEGSSPAP